MDQGKVRSEIFSWLKSHYAVEDISSGSGVPKLSRLRVTKGGTTLRYSVKISGNTGRISFTRQEDGIWKLLSDVDRVLYGFVSPDHPSQLRIMVFRQDTILDAFESTFQELQKNGQSHIPVWLNPSKEEGLRFHGSGFGKQAITEVTLELPDPQPEGRTHTTSSANAVTETPQKNGFMDEVKVLLANHLGVDPTKVELEIRILP